MSVQLPERLEPGDVLAERFRLEHVLGKGAMGTVWLARDTHLDDEPVACKLMSSALAPDRRAIAYLKREVLLTRRLRHPHIVAVYTFWDFDGVYFITMEYVDGQDLSSILADREAPFQIDEILPRVEQISQALDYAHEQGVLHRDIKPANFLLGSDGAMRLADFGIARPLRDMQNRATGGVACGTVMFMSPEQLMGEAVDERSDLYSLGASVYELLAGVPPFHRGAIVAQIQSKPAPPIEHLPDPVNAVLLRVLAKDPNDRHPSCGVFYRELAAAAEACKAEPIALPRGACQLHQSDPESATVILDTGGQQSVKGRLGSLLVDAGAITPEQLEEALKAQKQSDDRLGDILKRLGYVSGAAMAFALEHQLRIPLISLEQERFDPGVTALVGAGFARSRKCIPVRRIGERVMVVMADPLDLNTINVLEEIYGGQVELRIATETDILDAVDRVYGAS